MKTFALAAVAVVAAALGAGSPPRAQALDSDVHQRCLRAPAASCLIELAQLEWDAFAGEAPEIAPYSRTDWLQSLVAVQLANGDLGPAAAHLALIEPGDLRYLVEPDHPQALDLPAEIDADGRILRAMEDWLARVPVPPEDIADDLKRRADVAWVLEGLGYDARADEVLNAAVDLFIDALAARDFRAVAAAPDLMDAAGSLGAWEAADRLMGELTDPYLGEAAAEEDWMNQFIDWALRAYRSAEILRRLAEDPLSVTPAPQTDSLDLTRMALAWALDGQMDRVVDFIRGLPEGDDFGSRFVQIYFLVHDLLEQGRPDLAQTVAEEEISDWDRNNLLMSVATYYMGHGQSAQAEDLLDRMTDPGARSALLVWLAQARADTGEAAAARRLLRQGAEALAQEPDPLRHLFVNLDIAGVLATLGDAGAARMAVTTALDVLQQDYGDGGSDIDDPMLQFEAVLRAAAVLALLGDGMGALAPIEAMVGEEAPADIAYGGIQTAVALADGGRGDLAEELLGDLLRAMWDTPGIGHDDWSFLYLDAAQALIPGS